MMDADTVAKSGWLERIWGSFDDEGVAVVSGIEKYERHDGARMSYKTSSDSIRIAESKRGSTPILEGGLIAWRRDYFSGFRLDESLNADDTQLAMEAIRRGYRAIINNSIIFEDKRESSMDFSRSIRRSQGLSRALTRNLDLVFGSSFSNGGINIGFAFLTYVVLPWSLLIFCVSAPFAMSSNGYFGQISIGGSVSLGIWRVVNYLFFAILAITPQGRALAWGSLISLISHVQYSLGISYAVWNPGFKMDRKDV